MILNFMRNKKTLLPGDAVIPIRKMLEQTWDLSRQFSIHENACDKEAVHTFNLYFKKLNNIVTAILKNVVNMSSLAPALLHFSKNFKEKAQEQVGGIADISLAAKDMARHIEKTADNSQKISQDAELIENEVKAAQQLGQSSMNQFAEIQSHVQGLVQTITVLEDNSSSIGSITRQIHDIADETGILSLNARIEAAKQDSASKGFKVIAEEISLLAKQSQDAARDIQTRLDILGEKINETVTAVRMVEQNVVSGESMIFDANKALDSINHRIAHLSGNMGTIKESLTHQSSNVNNVSRDILAMETAVSLQSTEVEKIVSIAGKINNTCDEMIIDTGIFHLSAHRKACQQAEELAKDSMICSFNQSQQESQLAGYLKKNTYVELAYITDHQGKQVTNNIYSQQISNTEKLEKGYQKNWSVKEWFRQPVQTESAFISKVYRSSATRNFCFTVSVPLFKKGDLSGVLALDINFKDLLDI